MKRYIMLAIVCRRVGCKEDKPCYGTVDWCRQAREQATDSEWLTWETRFTEEMETPQQA